MSLMRKETGTATERTEEKDEEHNTERETETERQIDIESVNLHHETNLTS